MWWLYVSIALALFYYFIKRTQNYWKNKNVIQTNPTFLFGDNWKVVTHAAPFAEVHAEIYNKFPSHRYVGIYQFLTPTLLIRDPELIKQIGVKDFENFLDHRQLFSAKNDPLWSRTLFSLTGQEWHEMRQTLSPAFTSSKMRGMFVFMRENAEQFVKYFLDKNSNDVIELEMKDTFTRFANDVIANTAFGVGCDSLKNPENTFYLMGKDITNLSTFKRRLLFLGYTFLPKIVTLLNFKVFSDDIRNFFMNLVKDSINVREEKGISRPDMIHLMMEAKKHDLKYEESNDNTGFATVQESDLGKNMNNGNRIELTDMDMTAQALIFFFAGFDTVSSGMSFLSYELGVNPDIQQKLYEEIIETYHKCPDGKITYELLNGMRYMDMTVSEMLRKWPIAFIMDRVCTKPYTIEPVLPHEKPLTLNKGDYVIMSVYGIHRDPHYYPNPERFDPERFNETNRKNINPYIFMPFGIGPRNCIGSRFALLEIKAIFYHLLLNFEFVPVKRTQIPMELSTKQINMYAKNGFWLGLKRRNIKI